MEFYNRDAGHRGLVESGLFQLYPENQIGNGLYLNRNLLVSRHDQTVVSASKLKNTASTVYLYRDANRELWLGLVNGTGEGKGRLRRVDEEFYQYTNHDLGIQRVIRILNDKIKPLYENLRTTSGVTVSRTHAVFSHITESGNVSASDNLSEEPRWYYKFRLHLAKKGRPGVIALPGIRIENESARLRLFWQQDHVLGWRRSNGEIKLFNLLEYAPEMF